MAKRETMTSDLETEVPETMILEEDLEREIIGDIAWEIETDPGFTTRHEEAEDVYGYEAEEEPKLDEVQAESLKPKTSDKSRVKKTEQPPAGEQPLTIDKKADFFAFVYANWAMGRSLGPFDPVNAELLSELISRSVDDLMMAQADRTMMEKKIADLLNNPKIRQAKFKEAYEYRKRQEEIKETLWGTAAVT